GDKGLGDWRRGEGAGFQRSTRTSAQQTNPGLAICLASRRIELDGRIPTPSVIWVELRACGYAARSSNLWPGPEGGYVTYYERKAVERGLLLVDDSARLELNRRKSLQLAPMSTVDVEQEDFSKEALRALIRKRCLSFGGGVATSMTVAE